MPTTSQPTDRGQHTGHTGADVPVVHWPDPSHLQPWWDTIMGQQPHAHTRRTATT